MSQEFMNHFLYCLEHMPADSNHTVLAFFYFVALLHINLISYLITPIIHDFLPNIVCGLLIFVSVDVYQLTIARDFLIASESVVFATLFKLEAIEPIRLFIKIG